MKSEQWHKETKSFLNIWPYEWQKTVFAGTQREGRCFNNEFELTPDGLNCNRIRGKSVFLTLDGTIVGLVPISETVTQTVDYSEEYEIQKTYSRYLIGFSLGMCAEYLYRVKFSPYCLVVVVCLFLIVLIDLYTSKKES